MNSKLHELPLCLCIFFILFVTGYQLGCSLNSFDNVEEERTKLINEIESYQSIENFTLFINKQHLSWEVTADKKSMPGDTRPPFNIYEIVIKKYSHHDFDGDLFVTFFNDRLAEIRFYPVNIDDYIETLMKNDGFKFSEEHEAQVKPFTRVWFDIDYKKERYVGWSDTRLDEETDRWIKKYS